MQQNCATQTLVLLAWFLGILAGKLIAGQSTPKTCMFLILLLKPSILRPSLPQYEDQLTLRAVRMSVRAEGWSFSPRYLQIPSRIFPERRPKSGSNGEIDLGRCLGIAISDKIRK
ncbi:hypothetical protein IWX47DRAFT_245881 [Phyllosticta citricarpa]